MHRTGYIVRVAPVSLGRFFGFIAVGWELMLVSATQSRWEIRRRIGTWNGSFFCIASIRSVYWLGFDSVKSGES